MDSTCHSLCFASQAFSCEANTTARFTILSISTLEHKFVACIINFFIYVCGQFVLISIKWIELARPIICTYVTTLSLSLPLPIHVFPVFLPFISVNLNPEPRSLAHCIALSCLLLSFVYCHFFGGYYTKGFDQVFNLFVFCNYLIETLIP